MNHVNEEQLVLYYYGEEPGEVEAHLGGCEECRAAYHTLQRVLNSVDSLPVPERAADYEERVWQSISPKLDRRKRRAFGEWFAWQRWVPIGVTAPRGATSVTLSPA